MMIRARRTSRKMVFAGPLAAAALAVAVASAPAAQPAGFASIREINGGILGSAFTTSGYVVFKYECPPCPETTPCKPCMEPNIIISENPAMRADYTGLTDSELVVYTDEADKFALGRKYYFKVFIKPGWGSAAPRLEPGGWWVGEEAGGG